MAVTEQRRASMKAWQDAHREHLRAYSRRWKQGQREQRAAAGACPECGAMDQKRVADAPAGADWRYMRCAACLAKQAERQRAHYARKAAQRRNEVHV